MDYLPIQASAVLCKHIFSSSRKMCTKKHNYLSPAMMQRLNFLLKKEWLNFVKGWAASEWQMEYSTQIQCILELDDTHQEEFLSSARSTGSSHQHDTLLKTIAADECDSIPDVPALYSWCFFRLFYNLVYHYLVLTYAMSVQLSLSWFWLLILFSARLIHESKSVF